MSADGRERAGQELGCKPSGDLDHVVLEFRRGRRGVLRVSRESRQGNTSTRFRFWFPADDSETAELRPGSAVTIKDDELPVLICKLISIDKRRRAGMASGESFTEVTGPAPTSTQHRTIRASDDDERGLF